LRQPFLGNQRIRNRFQLFFILLFVEFENVSENVENGAVRIYNHRFRSKINRHKFRNWLRRYRRFSESRISRRGGEDIVLRERSDLPEFSAIVSLLEKELSFDLTLEFDFCGFE